MEKRIEEPKKWNDLQWTPRDRENWMLAVTKFGQVPKFNAQEELDVRLKSKNAQHLWYVSLVIRSKMADVLTGKETDEELAGMLTSTINPIDGWQWVFWEGRTIIGWRFPMNDMRVTEDGAHMLTYVEYKR